MLTVTVQEGGNRAVLAAPDTRERAAVLAALEGRKVWLRQGGISITWSAHNRAEIARIAPSAIFRELTPLPAPKQVPSGLYAPRTAPLPHQEEALARALASPNRCFALFMEPGTGKTKVAIDLAGELYARGEIKRVLIIAPKGVHRQWIVQQIPEHSGTAERATGAWPDLPEGEGLQFFAINYDAIKTRRGKEAISSFLVPGEPFLLVLDESHYVKNKRSQRWKAVGQIAGLRDASYKLLLTGTPIAKNLEDEWAQFWLLDPDIIGMRYVTTFRRTYCVMGGFKGYDVVGHRNIEKFKAVTAPYIYRVRREEIGVAPDEYRDWIFGLTARQKQLIDMAKREALIDIRLGVIARTHQIGPTLIKLQQISNGWIIDSRGYVQDVMKPENDPRLEALRDWLGESDLEEYPVAIWCRFREDISRICREYPEAYEYHGGTPDAKRAEAVEAWLDKGGIFIGTPGSGGTGLNLQGRCARVLYFSQSENYTHRVQSEARFSRIGKRGPVEFTDLVASGSRDRAIQRNLRDKKGLADLTLDDIVRELEGED